MYTVYKTAKYCPWCDKAIQLLKDKGLDHRVVVMGDNLKKTITEFAQMNTVPIVQKDVEIIGGYDALAKHLGE